MKNSKYPRHLLIKEDILHFLSNNSYKQNDKLPSETELSEMLHASRSTIRKSLELLEKDDLIERIQGMGTFVKKEISTITYNLEMLSSLKEILSVPKSALKTMRLKIEHGKADEKTAKNLKVKEGSNVIIIDRVRSLYDVPAVRSIDTIPEAIVPKNILLENIGISLSKFIHVDLGKSHAKIIPYKATAELAGQLQIVPDTLCLLVEETTYNTRGVPIDFSHEYYVSHLFNFVLTRKIMKKGQQ